MDSELVNKIDELLSELDNSNLIKDTLIFKQNIMNDKELLLLIEDLKNKKDYITNQEYIEKNQELFMNDDYKNFKKNESDINLLILSINSKLKSLLDDRGC
ncbi:MAG: hypothetical protein PHQ64_01340 [Bacilli bacterium]|nr:hypothetical protein [Bacilli bacterium]